MSDLAWTREKPTKKTGPGVYVYRRRPHLNCYCIEAREDDEGLYRMDWQGPPTDRHYVKDRKFEPWPGEGYWLGPLPEIVETADEAERNE